ncbi:MAG: hypothetical protein M0017_08425 [Desulfobacteraceae bacterium]|nr:hypothetical protein [Desulfobacteraceae bacterium]
MSFPPTLLYLHPLPYHGKRLLGGRWPDALELLGRHFRQNGIENQDQGEEVLVFAFSHPHTALAALQEGFAKLRQELSWQSSQGALPVQAVLHLAAGENGTPGEPFSAEVWHFLSQEAPYITRALKHQWDRLMAGRSLPPHSFQPEEQGLFRLVFADQGPIKVERLFPGRELPLVGSHRECFYCGMTHHAPAACPSKLLALPALGMPQIGYLPFAELDGLYRKALAGSDELVAALQAGIKASRVRQDPLLQVFLAFFDLNRLYQLRFLHQIAFGFFTSWEGVENNEKLQITNRNLHLGLDCLRVGQYGQAEQLFSEEVLRPHGAHFCASVGQAFRALEQGRDKDMESFLNKAASLAGQEKEKVYIGLLLSRFHDLQGDRWKAEHAVDAVLALNRSCPEAQYRKCQLLARNGNGEQAYKQIRSLITGERELFMTVLIDPMLTPVQGLMEDLLAGHARAVAENAEEALLRVRAECEELRGWFEGEDDPDLQGVLRSLAGIEQQHERQGHYDMLDVAEQADGLFYECHRLRENRIDRLKERLEQTGGSWEGYHSFWADYFYQPLFRRFKDILDAAREHLEQATRLSQEIRGEAFRAANGEAAAAEARLRDLQPLVTKMLWAGTALDGLRAFARKLVTAELLLIVLGGALWVLLQFYLAGGRSLAGQLLADPWTIKKGLSVVTLLIAPVLALALTLWEINKR